jgi:hypothetical protein
MCASFVQRSPLPAESWGEQYDINMAIYRHDYHNKGFCGRLSRLPSDGPRAHAAEDHAIEIAA